MTATSFFGYRVSCRGAEADAEESYGLLKAGHRGRVVATINPHATVVATENKIFQQALLQADQLLPDGMGVVLGGRILGLPIRERVAGYDFFSAFSRLANARGGVTYYFIGSSEKVLAAIAQRMATDYPGIKVVGTLSPPFKPEFSEEENAAMCAAINAAAPDVLWVGLTAPKQEMWVQQNRHRLKVGFSAAVGAVFDFYAGTKPRAPRWVQTMGFEWLYRFCLEPKRMWRRYLISNPRFVGMVLCEKVRMLCGHNG